MADPPPAEQKKTYWKRPNNYIRVATLLFVGGYTVLTYCALRISQENNTLSGQAVATANRSADAGNRAVDAAVRAADGATKQAGISEDTEKRQLRAYVGVDPGDVEWFGDNKKQVFTFKVKNYGLTPAYNVLPLYADLMIHPAGTPIRQTSTTCNPRTGLPTIFPTQVQVFRRFKAEFTSQEISLIKSFTNESLLPGRGPDNNQSVMVYLGELCYDDTFGVMHYTNWCFTFHGQSMAAKDAGVCLGHNESN